MVRGERVLAVLLVAAVAAWMIRAHGEGVDHPNLEVKQRLHDEVLENRAPDPYQYKLWPISRAIEIVRTSTGLPFDVVLYGNTLLSLVFLVLLHHLWLRTYVPLTTAALGTILLGALALVLFLNYQHHPYEFWGVGLYCLLLIGIERDARLTALVPVALLTGLVWEKHAVLPVLWGLLALGRGRPLGRTLLGGLVFLAASLAVPLWLRWHLGTDRPAVDGTTTWDVQPWGRVAWTQLPYVLPFLGVLLLRWRVVPAWVRLLWLALPIAAAAYASQAYILHEVRSFWLLAPVFTATFVTGLRPDPPTAPPTDPLQDRPLADPSRGQAPEPLSPR